MGVVQFQGQMEACRKLTFSYRFTNFVECTRVFAVHTSTKYSSDLQEHGKNSQKMRFDAITGLKTSFRSEAKVNPGSILYSLSPTLSSLLAKLANSQIAKLLLF